jgi:PAS domain S-box-containing protein
MSSVVPSDPATASNPSDIDFLAGGGHMGALIRAYPWARSPLGPPSEWPQPLRTALRILLTTNHPIFVFWGPELICFYNDAYRQSLGAEKHPSMLGARGREAWDEIWPIIGPQIEMVLAGRGATWFEDHLVPITRHGRREDVYWTYSYSPIDDESAPNNVGGVLVICSETTHKVLTERRLAFQLALNDRLRQLESVSDIVAAGAEMLGCQMNAARVGYGEIDESGHTGTLEQDWTAPGVPSIAGRHQIDTFGPALVAELKTGRVVRIVDAFDDPLVGAHAEIYRRIGTRSSITVPLLENERFAAVLFIHAVEPRLWSDAEVDLARVAAERIWEAVQRARAEAALRESEARWRALFDQVPSFKCILMGEEHRIVYANPRYVQLVGNRELIGKTIREALPDLADQGYHELLDRVFRTGEPYFGHESRVHLTRSPGEPPQTLYLDFAYQPIRDSSGNVVGIFVDGYDITTRVLSELAVRQREEELRHLNETLEQRVDRMLAERKLWADIFENMDSYVCAVDLDYRFLAFNRAYVERFEELFGVRPRTGDSLLELLPTEEARTEAHERWSRALAGEEFLTMREISKDGNAAPYEIRYSVLRDREGRRIGAFQVANDVTERVQNRARLAEAEESLRQSQKMEAVGQLTGGIAHDFNNLLTGIIGSLDMMQRRFAQGRTVDVHAYATAAMTAANRAASLTHRLLAFSRRQPLDPKPVNANRLVSSMEELLRRTLGETIRLEIVTTADVWLTRCDQNQLENAVLNLAINARDAMPDGGILTIEVSNAHIDERYAARTHDVVPGKYVSISVSDTGLGMTPDVLSKAFEPFFTTKPIGQGTGLGLSMIYGFVRQSEGHVSINSQPGCGTSVKLYLPRYDGEVATDDDAQCAPSVEQRAEHGEVVLVVEDEHVVRNLVVDVLQELGYQTLQAVDGRSGLEAIRHATQLDLLITDVGLPGMNGRQLVDAARAERPDLKVLFITGYAHNAAAGTGLLGPGMEIITKPFAIEALASRIKRMIEGR